MAVADDQELPRREKLRARVRETDAKPGLLKAAKLLRSVMPGDPEFGDPLDTAKDTSASLARTVPEAGSSRASVTRELGLGALQVWQHDLHRGRCCPTATPSCAPV